MVTAWVVKRKNLRHNKIITTIEFKGNGMTLEGMENYYSGNPDHELISVKEVDPQTAYNTRRKWKIEDA